MKLGPYRVAQELGSGGMGRVWKAADESLERTAAIKALHARHLEDRLMVMRFKREPLAMGRVNHPNVAQVYALEETPELIYFVMEYIDGRKLSDLITDEYRLPLPRAMEVFRQTAAALAEVHRRGIIHRDIKPGNIMVEPGGRAVLMDFGLAKMDTWSSGARSGGRDAMAAMREFDAQDTLHRGLVGTPAYLAPERWLRHEYDSRIDIYSFGVMMFHALTGELPFGVEPDNEMMAGHIKKRPRRVSVLAGPVPEMVESIVQRCMEKDPDKRFRDGDELYRALTFCEKDMDIGRSKLQKKIEKVDIKPDISADSDFVRNAVRMIGIVVIIALLLFGLLFLPLMAARMQMKARENKRHPAKKTTALFLPAAEVASSKSVDNGIGGD